MSKQVIEFDYACQSCGATGLYVGMCERDGSAVVCHDCKGTGKAHFKMEYEEFHARKPKPGVAWVVEVNPGICIGKGEHGQYTLELFGGMPYMNWRAGKPFEIGMENREFTCPAWWYQSADYKRKPDWRECGFGSFSDCRGFVNKEACWKKWDKQYRKPK